MSGLSTMATATYSTKRNPAKVAGKTGASVTNLTGVKMLPIMPLVQGETSVNTFPSSIKKAVSGRIKGYWLTSAEYQTHVDSTVSVTQVPDIIEGDVLVVGSKSYKVRDVQYLVLVGLYKGYDLLVVCRDGRVVESEKITRPNAMTILYPTPWAVAD